MSDSRKAVPSEGEPRLRVVVVGAGAVGLASARALLRAGSDVTVVERDTPGRRSTWAAGGMLAPLGESSGVDPFQRAAVESLKAYPGFASGVRDESGIDPVFRRTGKLVLATEPEGVRGLHDRSAWQAEAGFSTDVVDGDAARKIEPSLSEAVRAALVLPTDCHVESRLLAEALAGSVRALGGTIRSGATVVEVESTGGRTRGVRLDSGEVLTADAVVLAAGAWSGAVRGLPRELPVRPVRGQMLLLRSDAPLPRRLLSGPGAYVIPRGGLRTDEVVIGASQEDAGFDCRTDEATLDALLSAARRLVPALTRAERVDAWAGLRPGSDDDLPIIGEDPELPGLVYATGHFRNGILLTPFTATAVRDLVLGRPAWPELAAFRPDRFHGPVPDVSLALGEQGVPTRTGPGA